MGAENLDEAMRGRRGRADCSKVVYVQLHGGVVWERTDEGQVVEHVSRERLPREETDHKVLIWPAIRKLPFEEPFWTHHEHLVWSLQQARGILFVGYGFRDEGIRNLIRLALSPRSGDALPIVLWDPDPDGETYGRALTWLAGFRPEHVQREFRSDVVPYVLDALGLPVPGLPKVVDVADVQRRILDRAVRVALGIGPEDPLGPLDLGALTDIRLADEDAFDDDGLRLLVELPGLRRVNLDATTVSDIGVLCPLSRLERLYLAKTRVSDVGALRDHQCLPRLWELGLWHTDVSELSPLAGRDGLRVLNLAETKVSDSQMVHLSTLIGLVWLQLGGTPVSDVSHLSSLKRLQTLYLDETQVSDLSPLQGLQRLRTLYLANAPVSDREVARLRSALPHLVVVRSRESSAP